MSKEFSIGFAHELVHLVLNEEKIYTYRLGERYKSIKVGDEGNARDSSTNKAFARIKITEKSSTTFIDLPTNKKGHEVYSSKEEQRQVFEKYYTQINDNDEVTILGFKLIDRYDV